MVNSVNPVNSSVLRKDVMPKNDSPTDASAAAVAVTPPPVRRGRQGVEVDAALVASMKELIESGSWAGDGKTYPDKAKANKAIVDYKKALIAAGVTNDLTSRTWEDNGGVVIAVGVKGEQDAT